jgi:Pyruvate/2-oxoacid:ferredoxin oxidoreductase delta subunit
MIIRPSTRSWFRERRNTPGYSLFDFLHGYIYARWPYFYISIATGEHPLSKFYKRLYDRIFSLFKSRSTMTDARPTRDDQKLSAAARTFADAYHGKVVPLDQARKLVTINSDVSIRNLERVIPYSQARDIVLKNPDHIAVLQCPCRASRKNPCTPLEVCLIIGEPFAGFMLEHHPEKARRITTAEAVTILKEEDERGHVHHAFFKDAMLGRFYAICNCCKCCCGAMQAHRNGTPMLASSGYVAKVDTTRCVACGTCAKYCQFDAVVFVDGNKVIDRQKCFGCGVCVRKCPKNALTLEHDPERGVPLEMDALMH